MRTLLLLFVCAALGACVTTRPFEPAAGSAANAPSSSESGVQTQAVVTPDSTAPGQPLPSPAIKPRTLSAATKALVTQAQTQLNAGNAAMAAATIERALHIEPDNPLLWLELAKIRQDEGNAAQAENLARKALAMATGDNKIQAAAWRVIADSFRARGRNPEARDAEAKAQSLGG